MAKKEWEGDFDPLADPEEKKHLLSVLDSFRSYRRLAHYNGTHIRRQAFYSLPQEHWTLLSRPPFSLLDTFSRLDDLIDTNAILAEAIFCTGFKAFVAPSINSEWVASIVPEKYAHDEFKVYSLVMDHLDVKMSATDMDKARSCVNQFYREWSAEGEVERSKCFDPVMLALEQEFTAREQQVPGLDRASLNILVPGAGLGRLVFDICRKGFTVEGNEISYHELMASSLVLNHMRNAAQFTIAPFALNGSNNRTRADQFRTFAVPDIHPASALAAETSASRVPANERMSMSTGDFCVLYSAGEYKDAFDAVTSVFFIDTAPNVIRYVEAVRNCLKSGGIWINLGPLLWHHAEKKEEEEEEDRGERGESSEYRDHSESSESHDHSESASHSHSHSNPEISKTSHTHHSSSSSGIGDPGSVELTNEEVLALITHFGFMLEKHEENVGETGYMSNTRSMLQSVYRPVMWVARKK